MDNGSTNNVVLLPIRPKYAEAIQNGTKTIEFRKRNFRRSVKYVVVYASFPQKKILGYFEIKNIVVENPEVLWEKYEDVGGITKSEFQKYYKDSTSAVGLCILKFYPLLKPINLSQIKKGLRAPQSYCYLDSKSFDSVRRYA